MMSKLTGYAVPTFIPGADHTYVKCDNPAYSWGCWGRITGGKEICSGSGNAEFANCLSEPSSHAGIIYGITGVCHQTANRILFPANKVSVSEARGYPASVFVYGTYGLAIDGFHKRIKDCARLSGKSLTETFDVHEALSSEDCKEAYLQKVLAIYTGVSPNKDNFLRLLAEEFKLMMEFRLGRSLKPEIIGPVLKLQSELLSEKSEIDHNFTGGSIGVEKWVKEGNDLFTKTLRRVAEVVGNEQFEILFGISPPEETFILINPDIATNVYSSK